MEISHSGLKIIIWIHCIIVIKIQILILSPMLLASNAVIKYVDILLNKPSASNQGMVLDNSTTISSTGMGILHPQHFPLLLQQHMYLISAQCFVVMVVCDDCFVLTDY